MRRGTAPWRLPVAILLFVVSIGSSGSSGAALGSPQARRDDAPRLRALTRALATLDVPDLSGRRWTRADLQGRVVVLDFWATWCAPCLADLPWLRRARERFSPDRLMILGVSLDAGDRRTLTAWLNRHRIDWPQVWDHRGYSGDLARTFGVSSLPQSLLADTAGQVVATNLRGEQLLEGIARLLTDPLAR
jgi:thiol-disulfide isomerase/thioredoxin